MLRWHRTGGRRKERGISSGWRKGSRSWRWGKRSVRIIESAATDGRVMVEGGGGGGGGAVVVVVVERMERRLRTRRRMTLGVVKRAKNVFSVTAGHLAWPSRQEGFIIVSRVGVEFDRVCRTKEVKCVVLQPEVAVVAGSGTGVRWWWW